VRPFLFALHFLKRKKLLKLSEPRERQGQAEEEDGEDEEDYVRLL